MVTPTTLLAAVLAGGLIGWMLTPLRPIQAARNLAASGVVFLLLVMGARFLDGSARWQGWVGAVLLWTVCSGVTGIVLRWRA